MFVSLSDLHASGYYGTGGQQGQSVEDEGREGRGYSGNVGCNKWTCVCVCVVVCVCVWLCVWLCVLYGVCVCTCVCVDGGMNVDGGNESGWKRFTC